MNFPGLADRVAMVHQVIRQRQAAGGWTHPVTIVAVTKTHGPEAVSAAVEAGLDAVGENRVQEALAKQEALGPVPVAWHLVGSLQRNKARHAVGRFALIHSVDRLELAGELQRRLPEGARQAVLVQVNCSAEPQKGGVEPDALPEFLAGARAAGPARGARPDDHGGAHRRREGAAAGVPALRDGSAMPAEREGHRMPELSMGMSGDFARRRGGGSDDRAAGDRAVRGARL